MLEVRDLELVATLHRYHCPLRVSELVLFPFQFPPPLRLLSERLLALGAVVEPRSEQGEQTGEDDSAQSSCQCKLGSNRLSLSYNHAGIVAESRPSFASSGTVNAADWAPCA
jgi:hypothetical protein